MLNLKIYLLQVVNIFYKKIFPKVFKLFAFKDIGKPRCLYIVQKFVIITLKKLSSIFYIVIF